MLLLRIDRERDIPLYRQVVDGVVRLIDGETLKPGDRLPSTRALARRLGLNRFTVYRSYQELLALGYVESAPGSYTTVRKRLRLAPERTGGRGAVRWDAAASSRSRSLYDAFGRYLVEPAPPEGGADLVDLSRLEPDGRLFPIKDFQRSVNQVLSSMGAEILRYGSPQGYAPLREYIATRLRIHGVSASPRNVLVTSGAQQAIDLILRLFSQEGRNVACEAPTYSAVLPLMKFNGFNILDVPMRDDGMDLDYLERLVEGERVAFVYTVPNFQNPTGITTSQEHRERLLSICGRSRVPLIEDGFEEEMKYFGKAVLPIKSMDERQVVVYIGTFSKVLFPGIRIGWVTAHEECIERLTAIRRFCDLSSSLFAQAALDRFCRDGCYDRHLKRVHRIFRRRMETALAAMDRHFPRTVTWTRPAGGYTIWIRLGVRVDDALLRGAMTAFGVSASLGRFFFSSGKRDGHLRVSISALNEAEIVEGIERLARLLRAVTKKHGG
jgi:DNA-binding transcriptional MocR family regulator